MAAVVALIAPFEESLAGTAGRRPAVSLATLSLGRL
jgi:hypothetical protein